MAISIPPSLAAHQQGAARLPNVSLVANLKRSGVELLPFTRLYTGAEPDSPHAATLAGDGALIRARNQSGAISTSRVANPGPASTFGAWSSLTAATSGAPLALAARPGELLLAYVDSTDAKKIARRTSTDNGTSWSAATAIVTESAAIGFLALAFTPSGDACLFYTLGTTSTLKRLRRTSGTWAASGTTWSRNASAATLSGISAIHDGGDFALVITGTEATTNNPRVWSAIMGDLQLPTNAWSALIPIAEADAASTITFTAPGVTLAGVHYRASFVRKEAGGAAENRVYLAASPGTITSQWFEPAPHEASGTAGLAILASSAAAWGITPSGVWYAPLHPGQNLSERLINCSLRITPASTTATLELDDTTGAIAAGIPSLAPGATLLLIPGYASGTGGARQSGIVFELTIDRITSQLKNGRRTAHIDASGPWEIAQRWHAPQAWQVANGALSRAAIFDRFAIRAGLAPTQAGLPHAPSADWNGNKPPFTVPAGESAANLMARLLAPMPELLRTESGLQVVGTSPADAPEGAYGPGHHPITELTLTAEAWPRNWTRLAGSGRYADTFDPTQVYIAGPRFGVLSDPTAVDNLQAVHWSEAVLRKQQMLTPRGQLRAPFDCARQLLDVVTITEPALAAAATYRIIGLGLEYSRGPRPRFDSVFVLGGV